MPSPRLTVWLLATLGSLFQGCADVPLVAPPAAAPVAVATLSGPPTLDAGRPHADVAGIVTERLPSAPYVYFRVSPPAGTAQWVVTMGDCPPAGDPVVVEVMTVEHAFYSRRLDRTFDELAFGIARTPEHRTPGA